MIIYLSIQLIDLVNEIQTISFIIMLKIKSTSINKSTKHPELIYSKLNFYLPKFNFNNQIKHS